MVQVWFIGFLGDREWKVTTTVHCALKLSVLYLKKGESCIKYSQDSKGEEFTTQLVPPIQELCSLSCRLLTTACLEHLTGARWLS